MTSSYAESAYEAINAAQAFEQFKVTLSGEADRWLARLTELRQNAPQQPPHNQIGELIADGAKQADIDKAVAARAGAQHLLNGHQYAQELCGERVLSALLADRDRLHRELATPANALIEKLHTAATIDATVAELTKARRTDDAELIVWIDNDAETLRRLFFLRDEYLTVPGLQWSTGWWDASQFQNPWDMERPNVTDNTQWGQWRASIRAGGRLWFPTHEQAVAASQAHEPNLMPAIDPIRGRSATFVR